jgi:Polysaccharide lyase
MWRHLAVAQIVALLVAPLTPAGAALAAGAQPVDAGPAASAASAAAPAAWGQPGWKLRWAPQADRDGLRAFEHVEDDRAGSDPAGFPHIYTEGDHYRFNMNMNVRDTSTDRQRNEVRGAVAGDHALNLLYGETWRFTYSMFIPDTLKSTTRFSHIMQMKEPGTGSGPIVTMSLRRYGTVQKIELVDTVTNTLVGNVDLEPLQNHWVDFDFQMKVGDAPDGSIRWAVHDGAKTVIDTTMTGLDTWLGDRVRPKWGIYRSLGDTSGSLQDTYLLLKNLRAYQWTGALLPPLQIRYEAERARIFQGAVESKNGGYTGTGYVNYADTTGGYIEWTVFALCNGPAALNIWYANATDTVRPMDITVDGVPVATGLTFDRTPAWNDWETRTLITNLHFGLNKIRATATAAAGGPMVDSLDVQQPAPLL